MPKESSSKTKRDYEELGRRLESIYLTGYVDKKEMFKMTFLKGIFTGFGGVIGATLMVALLLWILSIFNHIPLIGPVFDNVKETVQSQDK